MNTEKIAELIINEQVELAYQLSKNYKIEDIKQNFLKLLVSSNIQQSELKNNLNSIYLDFRDKKIILVKTLLGLELVSYINNKLTKEIEKKIQEYGELCFLVQEFTELIFNNTKNIAKTQFDNLVNKCYETNKPITRFNERISKKDYGGQVYKFTILKVYKKDKCVKVNYVRNPHNHHRKEKKISIERCNLNRFYTLVKDVLL